MESKPVDEKEEFQAANDIVYGRLKKTRELGGADEVPVESPNAEEATAASDVNSEEANTSAPQQFNSIPNFLLPLLQRIQFSPPLFFQERLNQLKESLAGLGVAVSSNNGSTAKQFPTTNGLLHLVGLNDSGFYTDRLEPAGFLGGNGWFANKGGILGGPGAILSTGSLLTDYPTPYRR